MLSSVTSVAYPHGKQNKMASATPKTSSVAFPKLIPKQGFPTKKILICSFLLPGAKNGPGSSSSLAASQQRSPYPITLLAFKLTALPLPKTHVFPRGLKKHLRSQAQPTQVLQLPTASQNSGVSCRPPPSTSTPHAPQLRTFDVPRSTPHSPASHKPNPSRQ